MVCKLGARQIVFIAQRFCEYRAATREKIVIQFQFAGPVSVRRMNSGSREREQRTNVLRHNCAISNDFMISSFLATIPPNTAEPHLKKKNKSARKDAEPQRLRKEKHYSSNPKTIR